MGAGAAVSFPRCLGPLAHTGMIALHRTTAAPWCAGALALVLCLLSAPGGAVGELPRGPQVERYNVAWHSLQGFGKNKAGQQTYADAMPLGNGDVTALVW